MGFVGFDLFLMGLITNCVYSSIHMLFKVSSLYFVYGVFSYNLNSYSFIGYIVCAERWIWGKDKHEILVIIQN